MSRRKQAKPRACLKRKLGASGQWQDSNPQVATNWHGLHFHILSVFQHVPLLTSVLRVFVSVCVCVHLIDLLW